ncbi:MAG: alkaline phosphatase family protein [bacterium]|nr:alkaline phosphatase family protein [bacterium]
MSCLSSHAGRLPPPLIVAAALGLMSGDAVEAYVGPGAGLAIAGGMWGIALFGLALIAALLFPFRFACHFLRDRSRRRRARTRRVVVLGFDGLDAGITRKLLAAGQLPNLQRLAQQGSHHDLRTVLPAITPAAWPSFATGVDPSGHAIFDFIARDPQTYQPVLASAEILPGRRRRFRRTAPVLRSKRRSRPFWEVLADHRVFSIILRVPITWPPEPFRGLLLSGMSTPDLRGTQGEGTLMTAVTPPVETSGPLQVRLEAQDVGFVGRLPGPADPEHSEQTLSVSVTVVPKDAGARIDVGASTFDLALEADSAWLPVTFGSGRRQVHGICRMRLLCADPPSLYVTALQIDPLRPVMPVSHPVPFAEYLARQIGPFATVGLVEDTDALNTGVIDEAAFLAQVESLHCEREAMLLESLQRSRDGVVACVFDGSDRVQHMFYRTREADHPANRMAASMHPQAIDAAYQRADDTVGRVSEQLHEDDVLLVLSDHGFCSFRRGVDLNAWLCDRGYLTLNEGVTGRPWMADVDWSRTRAYALGLSGLYINLRGREGQGIVAPGAEYEALKLELVEALTGLVDTRNATVAVQRAYDTASYYRGPYAAEGPDVLVGYAAGYRVSWTTARGETAADVFVDNDRRWSGDHCVDPSLVPGVLFSNIALGVPDPGLTDVPVTILSLLGVDAPAYMQGRDLAEGVSL